MMTTLVIRGFDMTIVNKTPPSPPPGGTWTLAVAKARLSEVVDRAQAGPQTITRNGKPSAVVVSAEEWARKTVRKGTLAEFLLASPLRGADLEPERQRDRPRDVTL
jgi:prevent-host-death family protein